MKLADINWGDDSAERDPALLCYFVHTAAFQRLKDKQKSIIIGRKGSGKSAVRKKLEQHFSSDLGTHVINMSPSYNAVRNVLNDTDIINSFGTEIFFQHTWIRQIFLDCLCKFGDKIKGKFATASAEFARDISVQMNRTSKDFVENIADVLTRIKGKVDGLGEFGLSLEKELRNIADVDALEHHMRVLTGEGAKFVILIDDLDLGWNNSEAANNLLLGLLSATNYISSVSHNIYICIFLREDIYEILITKTQHSDKYRNVERIRWEIQNLMSILNERINYNRVRMSAHKLDNPFYSVFPQTIGTSVTENWMYERTLGRPRELIQLSRYYTEAVEYEEPSVESLKSCEYSYSEWKLDDLCAEYSNQYPGLVDVFSYWKTKFFRIKYHLKKSEIDDMLLSILSDLDLREDWFLAIVKDTDTTKLLQTLYEIGFIGDFVLGGEGGSKTVYSYQGRHVPRFEEVQIHPCFRKAVGTVERIRNRGQSVELDT
ncbi:hypothetical protein SAMN05421830_111119 [Desulfomicrobium norvegicum]|uniref:KAP family P-loop domain-containing protein n=1 Tax=Desulfomicrobium norvegicum (strain DSM 1741 / NCIMB 8310) TaxID=52561 RepID=A0A8G2C4S9_DESNO|nr:hypothetical protein [Desulfomicrobium norvegicum]SFM01705.1 hypothetical protein SAMN05421830_111119 [Desulfomicrobium norvegicum]